MEAPTKMETSDSSPAIQPEPRRPDFIIIGAMKSGTTTLYQYLTRHPGVFMSFPKEPEFFSREETYARGLDWYLSLFRGAREDQICGEASTGYSRWPHFGDVAARIHAAVPDTRFIYVMRNPVERAYSHYKHEMTERQLTRSGDIIPFEQALEEISEIVDTSLYRLQLDKYLEHFPKDRFLLLFLEELAENPAPELERVQHFLGLERSEAMLKSHIVANNFGDRLATYGMQDILDNVRRWPGVSTMKRLLPSNARAWIRRQFADRSVANVAMQRRIQALARQTTPLEDAVRIRLLQRFAGPNRALEELAGRRVPPSWQA